MLKSPAMMIAVVTLLCALVAPFPAALAAEPRVGYAVFQVLEMDKIDGVEQTFYVDFYLSMYWQEPEFYIDPANDGAGLNSSQLAFIQRTGTFEFMNVKNAQPAYEEWFGYSHVTRPPAIVAAGLPRNDSGRFAGSPWVEYDSRWKGHFAANLDLINFPFDNQEMVIQVEPLWWTDVEFIFAPGNWTPTNGIATTRPMAEWTILSWSMSPTLTHYPQWGEYYARNTAIGRLTRKADYYMNKIVSGIVMISIMAHISFGVPANDSNRLAFVLTCFLGVITYLFVISADVPKVAYTTRMDRFVNWSFFTIFADFVLMIIQAIVDHTLHTKDADDEPEDDDEDNDLAASKNAPDVYDDDEDGPSKTSEGPVKKKKKQNKNKRKRRTGKNLAAVRRVWVSIRRPVDYTLAAIMLVIYMIGVLTTFVAGVDK